MEPLDVLISSHPKLFRGTPPRVASWVPDGWAPLITRLCDDIESLLQDDCHRFTVTQIKEKFGTLRFYWRFVEAGNDWELRQHPINPMRFRSEPTKPDSLYRHLRELVDAAEAQTEKVCFRCGAPADSKASRGFYHYCSKQCELERYRGWQS